MQFIEKVPKNWLENLQQIRDYSTIILGLHFYSNEVNIQVSILEKKL